MVQVEDLRMMVGGIQERPGGTGGGDLRMMVGGIQERPGGTGGGPEDDGGWNTGETRWYRWRT